MENKRFERVFLLFAREDQEVYGGQSPSGYVKFEKIEGKFKITSSIQGLNRYSNDELSLYLFGRVNEEVKFFNAGILDFRQSKCELTREFNSEGLRGESEALKNIEGAVIAGIHTVREQPVVYCPLAAFKNNITIDFREGLKNFILKSRVEPPEKNIIEKAQIIEAAPPLYEELAEEQVCEEEPIKDKAEDIKGSAEVPERAEETVASIVDELQEIDAENAEEEMTSEQKEETAKTESIPEEEPEMKAAANIDGKNEVKSEETDAGPENEVKEKVGEYEQYQNMLRELGLMRDKTDSRDICMEPSTKLEKEVCDNCRMEAVQQSENNSQPLNISKLRIIFSRYFEPYEPFKIRRQDYRWWKVGSPVQLNNILYQNNIKTSLLFNPQLMMAHFKYRHIIVGTYSSRRNRKEYIVCGVPAIYNIDEKPFGEYCRWAQIESTKPRHGAFGYWLVYIDIKTGNFLGL